MVGAAVLSTEEIVVGVKLGDAFTVDVLFQFAGRFEPCLGVAVGHDIELDPEVGHPESMDNIHTVHEQLDGLSLWDRDDGDRLAGDLGGKRALRAVVVGHLPAPLLGFDVDFFSVCGGDVHEHVASETPDKHHRHDEQRQRRPRNFEGRIVRGAALSGDSLDAVIANDEINRQPDNQHKEERRHPEDEHEQRVAFWRERRGLLVEPHAMPKVPEGRSGEQREG